MGLLIAFGRAGRLSGVASLDLLRFAPSDTPTFAPKHPLRLSAPSMTADASGYPQSGAEFDSAAACDIVTVLQLLHTSLYNLKQ